MIIVAALGFVVAIVTQANVPTGWWLNTGQGVAVTSLVIVVLAFVMELVRPNRQTASALSWGVSIALTCVLLTHDGGGNLFPIVIAISSMHATVGVLAGSMAAVALLRGVRLLRSGFL